MKKQPSDLQKRWRELVDSTGDTIDWALEQAVQALGDIAYQRWGDRVRAGEWDPPGNSDLYELESELRRGLRGAVYILWNAGYRLKFEIVPRGEEE